MRPRASFRASLTLGALLALAGCGAGDSSDGLSDGQVGTAEEAIVVCPGPVTVEGIDVSYYQGTIDWGAVKSSGREFAITRINDGNFMDPKFDENWAGIKAAGMIRGAYQFFRPGMDANAQADVVIQKVGVLGVGDLPVTLDVEATDNQSPATIAAKIHVWVDKVKAGTGRDPIVYTGKYFWNDNVGTTDFGYLPLWLAAYVSPCPSTPDAWSTWRIWQYTSTGSIPGIGGNVDHDMFDGDLAALQALASPPDAPPVGYLDAADCASVRGWAQDPDAPDTAVAVHVYFNGNPGDPGATAIPTTADQHRDDLCLAIGSCNHGFSIPTPLSLLDGAPHAVAAFGIDTMGGNNPPLSGSPMTITCDAPALPVSYAKGVKRWITSPEILDAWKLSTFESLAHYPDDVIASYPKGPDLPATPVIVLADDGAPEVWVIDGDVRRHVTDPASFAAWHFDAAGLLQTWPAEEVYSHPKGADFRPTPFMVQGTDAPVYLLDVPLSGALGDPPLSGGAGGGGAGGGGGGANDPADESGCQCELGRSGDPGGAAWAGLVALAAVAARRRRDR